MVAHVATVAFLGLEARAVEVQVQLMPGLPAFIVVGLPDKAVRESCERVRGAIAAIGLALPPKRIIVNLSPADLPKEGSHYDLPIALGLLGALGVIDAETLASYVVVGELGLDARVAPSPGVLLAALHASERELGLICPAAQGPEAAWAGRLELGLEFEEHIAAGLADRVEQLAAYRAGELRHEAELERRRDSAEQSGRGRQFTLGIVSVIMGIPVSGIATAAGDGNTLAAMVVGWAGLVGINAVHALSLRRNRRRQ